jgi:signal transduction histidine kinase
LLNTRRILLAGFGGVLLLMLYAGVDATRVIGLIHAREAQIRRDYQSRNQLLNEIRSDLYLSGTYVRDYLLEPEARGADGHKLELEATRSRMESALQAYERILTRGEQQPFQGLRQELANYWRLLDPVFQWQPEQRKEYGYEFLRNEVFPRRMAMLDVADQIAAVNDRSLAAGAQSVEGLFSEFRLRLLVTLFVTMGLGTAVAAFSIRQILRLEEENAARRGELKELSARLVAAQENERRAISRELHDEVGQSLSAVLVELGNLAANLPPLENAPAKRHADTIRSLVESSVAAVRNISLLLRPSMLDDLGLVPALEWQAREVSRRTNLRVGVTADNVSDELPEAHKTCVYRLVQEALHNCSRHSGAQKVRIHVWQENERLRLTIQDDGHGFDARLEKGLGILGMEERVNHLHGAFSVDSKQGEGTLIGVSLPLEASK